MLSSSERIQGPLHPSQAVGSALLTSLEVTLAGRTVSDAPRGALSLLVPQHVADSSQAAAAQHSEMPFRKAALQQLPSQSLPAAGVTPSQVQNPAFGVDKFHATTTRPQTYTTSSKVPWHIS